MAFYLTGLEVEHEILSKKKTQFLETFMEKLMQKLTGIEEVAELEDVLDGLQDPPDPR